MTSHVISHVTTRQINHVTDQLLTRLTILTSRLADTNSAPKDNTLILNLTPLKTCLLVIEAVVTDLPSVMMLTC